MELESDRLSCHAEISVSKEGVHRRARQGPVYNSVSTQPEQIMKKALVVPSEDEHVAAYPAYPDGLYPSTEGMPASKQ
jgi:hypothetical protein